MLHASKPVQQALKQQAQGLARACRTIPGRSFSTSGMSIPRSKITPRRAAGGSLYHTIDDPSADQGSLVRFAAGKLPSSRDVVVKAMQAMGRDNVDKNDVANAVGYMLMLPLGAALNWHFNQHGMPVVAKVAVHTDREACIDEAEAKDKPRDDKYPALGITLYKKPPDGGLLDGASLKNQKSQEVYFVDLVPAGTLTHDAYELLTGNADEEAPLPPPGGNSLGRYLEGLKSWSRGDQPGGRSVDTDLLCVVARLVKSEFANHPGLPVACVCDGMNMLSIRTPDKQTVVEEKHGGGEKAMSCVHEFFTTSDDEKGAYVPSLLKPMFGQTWPTCKKLAEEWGGQE